MTNKGYKAFSERLKEHGYVFLPNHYVEEYKNILLFIEKYF